MELHPWKLDHRPVRLVCQCAWPAGNYRLDQLVLNRGRVYRRLVEPAGPLPIPVVADGRKRWAPIWGVQPYKCEVCGAEWRVGGHRLHKAMAHALATGRRTVWIDDAARLRKRHGIRRLVA